MAIHVTIKAYEQSDNVILCHIFFYSVMNLAKWANDVNVHQTYIRTYLSCNTPSQGTETVRPVSSMARLTGVSLANPRCVRSQL